LSGATVGAEDLWMGETVVPPGVASAPHHHGESESGIYVVSGNPVFVFRRNNGELARLITCPGDYVYVPPFAPHLEENPSTDEDAVIVVARTTQEAIVVNLEEL